MADAVNGEGVEVARYVGAMDVHASPVIELEGRLEKGDMAKILREWALKVAKM